MPGDLYIQIVSLRQALASLTEQPVKLGTFTFFSLPLSVYSHTVPPAGITSLPEGLCATTVLPLPTTLYLYFCSERVDFAFSTVLPVTDGTAVDNADSSLSV